MNHILFCTNGIGDKLLDVIGFTTYSHIKKINSEIILNDITKKYLFGMENIYNIELFNIDNIKISDNYSEDLSDKILFIDEKFSDISIKEGIDNKKEDYSIPFVIKNKSYPIIYYTPVITFNPVNIFEKLNREYSLNYIIKIFIKMSENIKPSEEIELFIPNNLNNCYGIHLRRTDKIKSIIDYNIRKKNNRHNWVNNDDEYCIIIDKIKNYILECIKNNSDSQFFIASEDNEYKKYFENWIIENNGNIIKIGDIQDKDDSFIPVLELFCLSRCKEIIQGIKYSSFSVISSLIGNKKIINFCEETEDSMINIFKYMLDFNNIPPNKNIDSNQLNNIRSICNNFSRINL